MATPRFAWGIDVGNRALKAIKLVRDGDTFRIDDFEVIEHEQILSQAGDNRDSLLQTSLARFAQKQSAKGGTVAIGVSGQQSFARFIKLPPVDPGKVTEIVKFEAVQQIPFPLADVEWSYQLFQAPDSPEVEVGIFAMRRELVNQTIQNFTDVGLEVSVVQMNPLAVYNGLYADNRIEGTTMIVDIGAENSDLIIAEGENIWMRSIPIGGNNFTEALVKSFKLKFPKAEELKRNAATSKYGRQILQAMKPVFSDLVGEIQRSIGFYSSTHRDSRIGKVLALGGTFRLPGLQKYLQQNLQLDVARIDRLHAPTPADARFATEFNENILSSVAAYGLALQAMGQGKISSSLLPEKIRRERLWREKVPWFALAASMFIAAAGIAVGTLYVNRNAIEAQAPTRQSINATLSKARNLDKQWKDIENSGSDDRALITNYLGLLNDRDITLHLTTRLGDSIPPINPAEWKKPRGDRQIVQLVGWAMHYQPDMSGVLAMTDADYNGQADSATTIMAQSGGSYNVVPGAVINRGGTGGGGAVPGRVFNREWGPRGGPPGSAQGPQYGASVAAPVTTVLPTVGQRGFVITMLVRTPFVGTATMGPTDLIARQVAAKLRDMKLTGKEPQADFSIERVTIPSQTKMMTLNAQGTVRPPKPPFSFTPPPNLVAGGNGPPAFINPTQPGPFGTAGQQGTTATPTPAELFPDLMRPGESVQNDSLVTVLIALTIDPPRPAAAVATAAPTK